MLSLNSKLLCTFSNHHDIENTVALINNHYDVVGKKIYVLSLENEAQYALTYNVEVGNMATKLQDTIAIHRDKDNNVLYTIDALEAINSQNAMRLNERKGTRFHVDWSDYKSSLILTRNKSLSVVKTKLNKVINL